MLRVMTYVQVLMFLMKALGPQVVREAIDDVLDTFEDRLPEEARKWIRDVLSIPDDIGGDLD